MGIPGLESYVEEHGCRENAGQVPFFYRVKLADVAARKKDPVIVVDLMSCLRKVYSDVGGLDVLCGGQHKEYKRLWEELLGRFSGLGFRMVFVYDGATGTDKRSEWVRRRYQSWDKFGVPVFDALKAGRYPKFGDTVSLPTLQTQEVLSLLLGCEVRTSPPGTEADELVCSLAKELGAVGILGQDSDYIIYDTGDATYLSAKHLDVNEMATYCYEKSGLCRYLGIGPAQLPVFALMKGNDLVSRDRLRPFHDWLMANVRDRRNFGHRVIEQVADYIVTSNVPSSNREISRCLDAIAADVLGGGRADSELARRVVDGYCLRSKKGAQEANQASSWDSAVEELCGQSAQLHSIATKLTFESSFVLQDYRESHLVPPVAFLNRGIMRRIYGVLLWERPGARKSEEDGGGFQISVEEWCFAGRGSLDSPTMQVPEAPPAGAHPGLKVLRDIQDQSEQTASARWRLLAHVISPRLDADKLRSVHAEHLYAACQLYYMQHESENGPVLGGWEVELLILQKLILPARSAESLAAIPIPPNVPDPRGVQLATLFCRSRVGMILKLLGGPVPREEALLVKNFDGKLFQWLYLEVKHGRVTAEDIMKREGVDEQTFRNLYNFTTSNGDRIRQLNNV